MRFHSNGGVRYPELDDNLDDEIRAWFWDHGLDIEDWTDVEELAEDIAFIADMDEEAYAVWAAREERLASEILPPKPKNTATVTHEPVPMQQQNAVTPAAKKPEDVLKKVAFDSKPLPIAPRQPFSSNNTRKRFLMSRQVRNSNLDDDLDDKASDWHWASDRDFEDWYESLEETEDGFKCVNGIEYSDDELWDLEFTRRGEEYMSDPPYDLLQIQKEIEALDRKRASASAHQSQSTNATVPFLIWLMIVGGLILLLIYARG